MKVRFFNHLRGGDDTDSERIYRWHIEKRSGHRFNLGVVTDKWKRCIEDYIRGALSLRASMEMFGYESQYPVPIDIDGELLDGSHRVACALALGIESVPVKRESRKTWAPAWDLTWFAQNGMAKEDLDRLCLDFEALKSSS